MAIIKPLRARRTKQPEERHASKSVGIAIQYVAAAQMVYHRALAQTGTDAVQKPISHETARRCHDPVPDELLR